MSDSIVKFFKGIATNGKRKDAKGVEKQKALSDSALSMANDHVYDIGSKPLPLKPLSPLSDYENNPFVTNLDSPNLSPIKLANRAYTPIKTSPTLKPSLKKSRSLPLLNDNHKTSKGKNKPMHKVAIVTPAPDFALTPLSQIIAQSKKDIVALRTIQEKRVTELQASGAIPRHGDDPVAKADAQDIIVDFEKLESNLEKFEEIYQQFLRYGSRYGSPVEEVHLVAMWCKDSKIDRRNVGTEGLEGRLKKRVEPLPAIPDCGL